MLILTTSWWPGNNCTTTATLTEDERNKLKWALETLGFVMPKHGTFTANEWTATIAQIYDTNNPQIAAAIDAIHKANR